MSSNKISLIIAIVIVVAFSIWWYGGNSKVQAPVALIESAKVQPNTLQTVIKASGSSDAALSQDMSAIDKELNLLNADSESLDQGLEDMPTAQ